MGYWINRRIIYLSLITIVLFSGCVSYRGAAPVIDGWNKKVASHSTYKVQPEDTLYSIAWAFGMDYRDLARINDLSAPYRIHVGQLLSMSYAKRALVHKRVKYVRRVSRPVGRTVRSVELKNIRVGHWLWPAKGQVVRRYSRKLGGNRGVDIAGRFSEVVVSSAAGMVVYSGDGLRAYGKLIIIKHNDSYLSAYAHNRRMLVKEGQFVKAGQKIATMGRNNTGKAILHFEIRRNGRPVDPLLYLGIVKK